MRARQDGFILLELLLAMTIMGILLAALLPVWQVGLQSWTKQTNELMVSQDARMALDYIAREVRRARTVRIVHDSLAANDVMLYLEVDEITYKSGIRNVATKTVRYYQQGLNLYRRAANDSGPGTNPVVGPILEHNGFEFFIIDPVTNVRARSAPKQLASNEAVELTIRCRIDGRDHTVTTTVSPRNLTGG